MAGLTAGCVGLKPVEDSTRYYLLPGVEDSAPDTSDALSVGLHPLILPPYLERREIAIQQGSSQIVYLDGLRWADGLAAALQRSLVQHLQGQATIRDVIPAPWVRPSEFDRTIEVRIDECQGRDDGVVRLSASWEILPGPNRGRGVFSGTWSPGDTSGLVYELGALVRQLAAAIHEDL